MPTQKPSTFCHKLRSMSTSSVRKVTPAMPMAAVAYHRRQEPAGTSDGGHDGRDDGHRQRDDEREFRLVRGPPHQALQERGQQGHGDDRIPHLKGAQSLASNGRGIRIRVSVDNDLLDPQ